MEIDKWIRAARAHKGWTQQQLADVVGRTKANVGHWETGKHEPGMDQLAAISHATGHPLPRIGVLVEESNVASGPSTHGPYPLISEVQAGAWTELCDNFSPGDAENWLPSTKNLGACGFLLRVTGKSMENPGGRYNFAEGIILHVNPDLEPTPGQFVVVRRESTQQATFKRYVMIDGEPYLEAINPDWPKDMKYMKLQKGDAWCGVVVDASFGNLP